MMSTQKIKLMADYQCYPLWNVEEVGNIDPNKLPISTVLKKHLNSWAECYDETLVIEEPKLSGFNNEKEALAFEEQGRFLWQQLQKELGNQYEIFYFSHLASQLLKTEKVGKLVFSSHTKALPTNVYIEVPAI
jgi:hypothetical protein